MRRGRCEHVYLGAPIKGFIMSEPSLRVPKSIPIDLCAKCYSLANSSPAEPRRSNRR